MRGHLTFHRTPEAVKYYFPKSACILTGTIFVKNADRAYDHFSKYSRHGEDSFFHITLSLPTGMTLSPPRWRDEIREHLKARGANSSQCPWLAWRDTSTASEHIHLYGLLRTFDGRPVAVRDDNVVGTAFHPELTDDQRVHEYFLREVAGKSSEVL